MSDSFRKRWLSALLLVVILISLPNSIFPYPIAFPRPELGQSLSERLLSLIYKVDFHPGANKLPSLHVTFTWIIYLVCHKQQLKRLGDALLFFFALLITLSALLVKQHTILDVIAGIFWAIASWRLAIFILS